MIIGSKTWSNWSGSAVCKPEKICIPKDGVDLAATIRGASGTVRVAGVGMTDAPVCVTDGLLLGTNTFESLNGFDCEKEVAYIGSGTYLWDVASMLHRQGYALRSMPDNDRGTLGGAITIGAHGSGYNIGCMASDVESFTLVSASGEVIVSCRDSNPEIYAAGRLSLGLFGVITEIGMKVRPRFKLLKNYFVHSVEETFRQLDGMAKANQFFEFAWYPCNDYVVCKALNETRARAPEPRLSQAMRARGDRKTPKALLISAINEALPYAPWMQKSAHRALAVLRRSFGRVRWSNETFPSPRTVRFHELEYAVPYEKGPDAVREIAEALRKKKISTGFPIVCRIVDGDDIWLSPFYGRKSMAISVQSYFRHDAGPLFATAEEILRKYDGRPHWGTLHTMKADDLARVYPKYDDFRAIRRELDPNGRFLTPYLQAYLPA